MFGYAQQGQERSVTPEIGGKPMGTVSGFWSGCVMALTVSG
jgi:hypothetical protein